jgi:hypothetical protein
MTQSNDKSLEIIFGGDVHEIDADLLIESLVNYSFIVQETAVYLSPEAKVNIKIKALNPGSFRVFLDLTAYVKDVFTPDGLGMAASIVVIVGGIYKLKQWITKNGQPENIRQIDQNNIEISNNKGTIIINNYSYNIYQENPRVREKLRNTFEKLKEAGEITEFSIVDIETKSDIFRAPKEEFSILASSSDEIEQRKQKVLLEKQELIVFKIVFKENYKWEFFYKGNKIFAFIKDRHFFDKIEKGQIAFRSGDKLIVDLEIEQVFNEAVNIFINESYQILKVIEHIPRAPLIQLSLDFEK